MHSNDHLIDIENKAVITDYYKKLLYILNEFNSKTGISLDDINIFTSQRQKIYDLIQQIANTSDYSQAEISSIIQQIQLEEAKTKIIIEKELSQTKNELLKLQNLKRNNAKYISMSDQEARFVDKFK